jgi:hypothetical protein
MTTDTDLRDLLTSEAAGATVASGWDDVVRRGRHRQRVRRARGGALAALAVGAVVGAVALSSDDPSVETIPPATTDAIAPPTTQPQSATTSTTVTAPTAPDHVISAARAHGAFLTLIIPPADPSTGFDPCTDLHPRAPQSSDQIGIELVTDDVERGLPWVGCLSSAFSATGTLELLEPYAGQPVIDLTTGNEVHVVDGASLLFPTELPEEFTPGVWDEFAFEDTWTFSWSADDLYLNVTTGYGGTGECDREAIEVRGTTGRLCRGAASLYDLHWEEGGRTIAIEIGHVSDGEAPFTLEDVLAIAEGLEPYDEAGPDAPGT